MLGVPVRRAKRAAGASCVLSPSVSWRLPRSTVASVGLHGLGNAWQLITPGVFDAIVMRALDGRVLTEPWTSFCVRRLARFEIAGVDASSTLGAAVPRYLGLALEEAVCVETSHSRRSCPAESVCAKRARR